MRIGVVSDTHMPRTASELPEKLREDFKKVDLILHAGDITSSEVLKTLKEIAPIRAVYGNMDDLELQDSLPVKKIVKAGKFKIGLMHGFGPPFGLIERVGKEFKGVDAIVFGHSHSPINVVKKGVLFFNPGSPTDTIFTRQSSYGILEINDTIKGEIIKL
ncbi:MAG: metallophosphoesterase family protein [Candidatus Omnitrophota bacterium]